MKWESKHDGHEQSLGEDVRFIAGFCSGWRKRYRAPLSITRDLTQLWHQIVPILLFTLPKLNCWRIPTRFCLTSTYKRARFIKEHGRGARTAYFILLDESNFAGCHSPDLVRVRLPPNHRPQHPPPFALPFGTTMSGFGDRLRGEQRFRNPFDEAKTMLRFPCFSHFMVVCGTPGAAITCTIQRCGWTS